MFELLCVGAIYLAQVELTVVGLVEALEGRL